MGTIWCFTTDPLVVKEECVPINFCKDTLISTGISSKTIKFNEPTHLFSIENEIVVNTKPSQCQLSSCQILTQDCSFTYTGSDLTISNLSPFDVSLATTSADHG